MGGITYTLIYDAENRLVQIKRGNDVLATYYYDGDGNRIRTEVGSTITTYIGSYLERECIDSTCTMKKYYSAAGQRVALRKGDGTLYFLLTDHLGSTAITATSSGGARCRAEVLSLGWDEVYLWDDADIIQIHRAAGSRGGVVLLRGEIL